MQGMWKQRRAVAGQWGSIVLLGVAAFGLLAMGVGAMGASIHWWVVSLGR